MKRTIGIFALVLGIITFILFVCASTRYDVSQIAPMLFVYGASMFTAFVCLIGDVIRFIGKCFSQGYNSVNVKQERIACPLCGKQLPADSRFCGECGCEIVKKDS